jgi:hypothetical protein
MGAPLGACRYDTPPIKGPLDTSCCPCPLAPPSIETHIALKTPNEQAAIDAGRRWAANCGYAEIAVVTKLLLRSAASAESPVPLILNTVPSGCHDFAFFH